MPATIEQDEKPNIDIDRSVGDFRYDVNYEFDAGVGLSEATIDYICDVKKDPEWIREFRKDGYRKFLEKPMPTHWATKDLDNIVFENIRYYLSQGTQPKRSWDDVPEEMIGTLREGADYGWPDCYGDQVVEPELGGDATRCAQMPIHPPSAPRPAHLSAPECARHRTAPARDGRRHRRWRDRRGPDRRPAIRRR